MKVTREEYIELQTGNLIRLHLNECGEISDIEVLVYKVLVYLETLTLEELYDLRLANMENDFLLEAIDIVFDEKMKRAAGHDYQSTPSGIERA